MANQGISKEWSPIIPNSQLAVFTIPNSAEDWAIRIYVLPTESLIYVIIMSGVLLILLGTGLAVMKYNQYKRRPQMYDLI